MTNTDLFESNMYKEVIKQYDEVSEFINLDSNIRERLKLPQRALTVTFPFRRDEYDEVETVVGFRVQHVLSWDQLKVELGTMLMLTWVKSQLSQF